MPATIQPQAQRAIPSLLYIGRVHSSKNVEQLFAYTTRYRAEGGLPLRLIFAGRADIAMPSHPDVSYTGFIGEEEKARLLGECALVMMPSAYESLSITCLEAWASSRATLVNGDSDVLRAQSLRSGGGLYYRSYAEFAAALDLLLQEGTVGSDITRMALLIVVLALTQAMFRYFMRRTMIFASWRVVSRIRRDLFA
ncbi:glycosyltransferase, partial [Candidatus Gracilibacteria bacterium]|nr:glycosyltransferase [Candidatus Gracilibacteria bacterium]